MKKFLKDVSVASILTAVIGLVLLIIPNISNKIIVYGIGAVLLIYGIFRIIRYARREAGEAMMAHDLSYGLICLASGLFLLVYPSVIISILPFMFGLFLVFGGALSIQSAFDVRRFHGSYWVVYLAAGIIYVIVGMVVIRNPFSAAGVMTRFVGACLMVLGIYMFVVNRKISALRKRFISGPDIIDEQ